MDNDRVLAEATAVHTAITVAALDEIAVDRDPDTGSFVKFSTSEVLAVRCALCPRSRSRKVAVVQESPVGALFTAVPVVHEPVAACLDLLRDDPAVRSFFHNLWTNPVLSWLTCPTHGAVPVPAPLALIRAVDGGLKVMHTPQHVVA